MRSRWFTTLAILTTMVLILLITKIAILLKEQRKCQDEYYNCVKIKSQTMQNNELLLKWNTTQYQLWLSCFNDLGSLSSDSRNHFSMTKNIWNGKLIYWFSSEKACRDCVNEDINILKNEADSIGYDNILVISDFENDRERKIFEAKHQLFDRCLIFKPGIVLTKIIKETSFVRLFFILNNNNEVLFPTFTDLRFESLKLSLDKAVEFLKFKMTEDQLDSLTFINK